MDIIQGSPEWFAVRAGKITASKINAVLATIGKGEAAEKVKYRAELLVERFTGRKSEGYTNAAMQWGTDCEPLARAAYEAETGLMVQQVGFVDHPTIALTGASPDGLVGDDGLLEIKCPETSTHFDWLLNESAPTKHHNQMLWQMECTGRSWCDFMSFDPRVPPDFQILIVRFYRDEKRLKEIRQKVIQFSEEIDLMMKRLEALRLKRQQQKGIDRK